MASSNTCVGCGKPLTRPGAMLCTSCQVAVNQKHEREAFYRTPKIGQWLLLTFGFWVIASVIWVVLLAFVDGLLGNIIPTDFFKLALILAGPVVTFVLFFFRHWGGTMFNLWPRRRKGSGPAMICVTCDSQGVEGGTFHSSQFGEVFICNRCLKARARDNRLWMGFGGIITSGMFIVLGLGFFSPNLGASTSSTSLSNGTLTTTTISTPALEGLAGTIFAYIPGIALVLLGLAIGGLILWFLVFRSGGQTIQSVGKEIAG